MIATNNYVRAIRGPVLLIVAGILLLVDHAGALSIWRSWPVLVVAAGLLMLAERLLAPAQPTAPPRELERGGPQ